MGENELTFLVFGALNVNLYGVTYFKVRIVTELRSHNDTFALVTDVDNHFPLADGCDCTFYNLALCNFGKGFLVSLGNLSPVAVLTFILKCIPVKISGIH